MIITYVATAIRYYVNCTAISYLNMCKYSFRLKEKQKFRELEFEPYTRVKMVQQLFLKIGVGNYKNCLDLSNGEEELK